MEQGRWQQQRQDQREVLLAGRPFFLVLFEKVIEWQKEMRIKE
jgi:hypothetical protein